MQQIDFWQVLEKRHCVRKFDPTKKVKKGDLKRILSAGHKNPTAGGLHPEKFIIIEEDIVKQGLAEAAFGQLFLAEAAVVLVICADLKIAGLKYGKRGEKLYSVQDTAAAAQNIFLAATALGIDACWVGGFEEQKIQRILGLSKNLRPLVIMPLGYSSNAHSL